MLETAEQPTNHGRSLVGFCIVASLVVALIGLSGCTRAQSFGPWAGIVTDAVTGQPLPGVTMKVTWRSSESYFVMGIDGPVLFSYWAGATNDDGQFVMPKLTQRVGTAWVGMDALFEKDGYRPLLVLEQDPGLPVQVDYQVAGRLQGEIVVKMNPEAMKPAAAPGAVPGAKAPKKD